MADHRAADDHDGRSPQFDRVRSGPPAFRRRDRLGKEALYSTAPTAAPAAHVELACQRCGVPFGLALADVARLLAPPFLWDPVRGRLWVRCPACGRRSWLRVRAGQALRTWLRAGARP